MRISLGDFRRIVVAVDPATTSGEDSDETGILVVADGPHIEIPDIETVCRVPGCNRHGYVLDDRSGKYTPDQWARVVTETFHRWKADRIVAEGNQGGEMVENTIRTVFPSAPFRRVHARQGKRTRAEPVAALYEQARVHHCGTFPRLEDQLTTWTIDSGESPDRLDALVWGMVELGLAQYGQGAAFLEMWKNRAERAHLSTVVADDGAVVIDIGGRKARQQAIDRMTQRRQERCHHRWGPPAGRVRACVRCELVIEEAVDDANPDGGAAPGQA